MNVTIYILSLFGWWRLNVTFECGKIHGWNTVELKYSPWLEHMLQPVWKKRQMIPSPTKTCMLRSWNGTTLSFVGVSSNSFPLILESRRIHWLLHHLRCVCSRWDERELVSVQGVKGHRFRKRKRTKCQRERERERERQRKRGRASVWTQSANSKNIE